jgi:hypothetical protein
MSEKLEKFKTFSKVSSWLSDLKDIDILKDLLLEELRKDVDFASVLYNIAEREIDHHDSVERQIMREDKLREEDQNQEDHE